MDSELRDALLDLIDIRKRELRHHLLVGALLMGVSTGVYAACEHLAPFNALYLSVVTMSTIGYGDISPHTYGGRLMTMALIPLSVILHASWLQVVAARSRREGGHDPQN